MENALEGEWIERQRTSEREGGLYLADEVICHKELGLWGLIKMLSSDTSDLQSFGSKNNLFPLKRFQR